MEFVALASYSQIYPRLDGVATQPLRSVQTLAHAQVNTTLLNHAVMNNVTEATTSLLLNRGASARAPGPEGISPLHVAAATGELSLARLLVEHGADVTAVLPGTQITPMVMALSNDKVLM
jgi:ankyrin repeat protein